MFGLLASRMFLVTVIVEGESYSQPTFRIMDLCWRNNMTLYILKKLKMPFNIFANFTNSGFHVKDELFYDVILVLWSSTCFVSR